MGNALVNGNPPSVTFPQAAVHAEHLPINLSKFGIWPSPLTRVLLGHMLIVLILENESMPNIKLTLSYGKIRLTSVMKVAVHL